MDLSSIHCIWAKDDNGSGRSGVKVGLGPDPKNFGALVSVPTLTLGVN